MLRMGADHACSLLKLGTLRSRRTAWFTSDRHPMVLPLLSLLLVPSWCPVDSAGAWFTGALSLSCLRGAFPFAADLRSYYAELYVALPHSLMLFRGLETASVTYLERPYPLC